MMTENEVIETLGEMIFDDLIFLSDINVIFIDDFIEKFKGSDLTFKSLKNNRNTTDGWLLYFEEWRDKKIIN